MKKPSKAGPLDPAAVCRSSDPMAVRELLTKIGDKWTIFLDPFARPPRRTRSILRTRTCGSRDFTADAVCDPEESRT